jgi:hypothetical protein
MLALINGRCLSYFRIINRIFFSSMPRSSQSKCDYHRSSNGFLLCCPFGTQRPCPWSMLSATNVTPKACTCRWPLATASTSPSSYAAPRVVASLHAVSFVVPRALTSLGTTVTPPSAWDTTSHQSLRHIVEFVLAYFE